jgi:hypothetical protein
LEHGLRMFDKKVLRRIFGLRRHEMMGEWKEMA